MMAAAFVDDISFVWELWQLESFRKTKVEAGLEKAQFCITIFIRCICLVIL